VRALLFVYAICMFLTPEIIAQTIDKDKILEDLGQKFVPNGITQINPFETDISAIDIAIRTNNGFHHLPQSTKYILQVTDGNNDIAIDETFIFEPLIDPENAFLKQETPDGYQMNFFSLSKRDKARVVCPLRVVQP